MRENGSRGQGRLGLRIATQVVAALLFGGVLVIGGAHAAGPPIPAQKQDPLRAASNLAAKAPFVPEQAGTVLSETDAERYRRIFASQEAGQWRAADTLIARLENKRLLGHVYAQRYMHPRLYRSRYAELAGWLERYADHPDAARIYKLALSRKPRGAAEPRAPVSSESRPPKGARATGEDEAELDGGEAPTAAERALTLKSSPESAPESAKHRRGGSPTAYWAAGLSAWRLDRLEVAARNFEALAHARKVSDWSRAAGGFWAARAHMALGNPDRASAWLAEAAEYRYTFYGLLARRVLGPDPEFGWATPVLTKKDATVLASTGRGWRALALIQAGQNQRAERELVGLDARDPALGRALVAIATNAEMPALALRLAARAGQALGAQLDSALYPIPPWTPPEGFAVDPALIYAIMRQESAFDAQATSPAGARGLMQLMPATARFTASLDRLSGVSTSALYDPELNVALGQRFLRYLLEHPEVEGNLFRLAVAYNAGPGNLSKWDRKVRHEGDPLLFIESIPARETRGFVQRVLANLWIYRMRFGQPSPSLDSLAAGEWPSYAPLHLNDDEIARNAED